MGLKIILWTQKSKADGSCIIKVYLNRDKHKYYSLKNLYCTEKQWGNGLVKHTHPNYQYINSEIIKARNGFEKIMIENPKATVNEIVKIYESGSSSGKLSLLDFIKQFIEECRDGKIQRASGTIQVYNATLKRLKEFNPDIDFGSIDKDFYNSFTSWLRDKGLINNGIGKHIKTLKTFLNEASERNIYTAMEHRKKYFKVPHNETDAVYLNEKEINKVIGLNLSKHPHLQQERDRFIVSYFFILRYSDSIRIDKSMFFKEKKKLFIRLRSQKTGIETILPVKPMAKKILERNNYALNFDTNQESNWKIKEIVSLAKIDKSKEGKVTTHTARRSGATNLFLAGVPEKTIMDLGGWKKVDTFRKYIRASALETAHKMANHAFFK